MNQCKCCGGMGCEVCGYGAGFASPVQGAASFAPGWNISCTVTDGATSSASGAKGALLAEIQAALDSLADTKMTTHTYTSMANVLHHCRDAITGRGYYGEAALADRSPAVQPTPQRSPFEGGTNFMVGMDSMLRCYENSDNGQIPTSAVRAYVLSFQPATPAPEQEAAPLDLAALIDECREAVTYWEPLRQFIEQFDAKLEQEAAPKCPRCKDTRKWTHTDEAGDHGDEYPCMDCGAREADPVAPPEAQEVHFFRQKGRPGAEWVRIAAEHLKIVQNGPSAEAFEYQTLYTAPVPATTPAEQPEGDPSHVMPPFAAPAGQHDWISTNERLPEDRQAVAFVVDSADWSRFKYLNGRVLGGQYTESDGCFSVPGLGLHASYWMPLPSPPEQSAASGSREGRVACPDAGSVGHLSCATATNTNQPEGAGESQ